MGNLCDGTNNLPTQRGSHAYCEGRAVAVAGGATSGNPFQAKNPDHAIWAAGFASWATAPGGIKSDCCADAPGGGHAATP